MAGMVRQGLRAQQASVMTQEDVEHMIDETVLRLISAGLDNQQIAGALHMKAVELDRGKIKGATRQ
jgi:hypothetical protein